mmetsp:Transcript_10528/g.19646  ORF Transcript_10528/g.19646 Transcript_10528/m.19646 type:complete len:446 (-) Transcript_10528:497-1834(-)
MTNRLKKEYTSNREFLSEAVRDDTSNKVLGTAEGIDEIASIMGTATTKTVGKGEKKRKHEQQQDNDAGHSNVLSVIKENALTLHDKDVKEEQDDEESHQASIKKKKDKDTNKNKKQKITKLSPVEVKQAEAYEKYSAWKVDQLKDILRWNKTPCTGNKDLLLLRIIDGEVYGRLGKCPICVKGQLKLNDEGTEVQCKGFFNEDIGAHEACYFSIDPARARRHVWFNHEPTKEEQEEMKNEQQAVKTDTDGSAAVLPVHFLQNIKTNMEWNVSNKEGIKQTTLTLSKILSSDDSPIAIPSNIDTSKVRMEVGKIILQNKDKSMEDILELITQKYGLKENKEKEDKVKEKMTASICHVEANAKICNLFRDLAAAYSAEGNRHAATTYRKVVGVIIDLDFEITVDNAKGLGSGKNKVPGIGKKSAEYMQEFLETGTLQKLEEKKAGME